MSIAGQIRWDAIMVTGSVAAGVILTAFAMWCSRSETQNSSPQAYSPRQSARYIWICNSDDERSADDAFGRVTPMSIETSLTVQFDSTLIPIKQEKPGSLLELPIFSGLECREV